MRKILHNISPFFLLAIMGLPLHGQERIDENLGIELLTLAYEKYQTGDLEAAKVVAEEILLFTPLSSDALYLSILPLQAQQSASLLVQDRLEAALTSDSWYYFSPAAAELTLAHLFFRTRQWALLGALELFDREQRPADIWDFHLQMLLVEGKRDEAEALREEAAIWYPQDVRFRYPWILDATLVDPVVVYDLLQYSANTPEYRRLLSQIIPRLSDPDGEKELLARYFSLGGNAPLMAIRASVYPDLADMGSRFIEWGALGNKYLLDYVRAQQEDYPAAYRQLSVAFADFTGRTGYDRDFDGYDEQAFTAVRGRVQEWQIDENQDGRIELSLRFTDTEALPASATLSTPTTSLEVFYDYYPQVTSIRSDDNDSSEYVYFRAGSFSFPLLQAPLEDLPGRPSILSPFLFEIPENLPSTDTITNSAALRVQQEEGRIVFFREGTPWLEVLDNNQDGILDELRYLDKGLQRLKFMDSDYDGWFDKREQYSNGKTENIAADYDKDYLTEFFFEPELNQQLWNFSPSSRENIRGDVQQMLSSLQYAENLLRFYLSEGSQ